MFQWVEESVCVVKQVQIVHKARGKGKYAMMIHKPDSNLIKSMILDVAISSCMESLTLMSGSGYRMVRPSCVTKKGTFLGPVATRLTLQSLYCKCI